MTEHRDRENANDEQEQGQDESPHSGVPGTSDAAPAEAGIPLPEESDLSEEA
ncbi:MAG TPA: hypothetical protein VGV40_03620 [Solirubrobacteraceae bacterium]|nr:hypothetical protein [Solirubrobacteraceae bacterium]